MSDPVEAGDQGGAVEGVSAGAHGVPRPEPAAALSGSVLTDGAWHRLHPLTPVFRGGLVVVVVAGVLIANLRERLLAFVVPMFAPAPQPPADDPRDPVDYVFAHNLVFLVLLGAIVVALLLVGLFALSWRFRTFRVTAADVEVRRGVLFRSHRRAPLDRVQGVNLTRPLVARLVGMAKLEVMGAGLDSNVELSYLSTRSAEAVRRDILRLASGVRAETDAAGPGPHAGRLASARAAVGDGLTGLVFGAEPAPDRSESVVHVTPLRLIGAQVLSDDTVWWLIGSTAVIVAGALWFPPGLFLALPFILGYGGYAARHVVRALRYAIVPTPHGVRVTYGVLTTVTETIPPGRVHAVAISQSVLWRGTGWWTVTVTRISGTRHGEQRAEEFARVMPVGTLDDAKRVVALLLPWLSAHELDTMTDAAHARAAGGFTTTPRRARLLRPLAWRRNGFALGSRVVTFRRGFLARSAALFPLGRAQGVELAQGPIDRAFGVARVRVVTVRGHVRTRLGAIDADAAASLAGDVAAGAAAPDTVAAATEREESHA